MKKFAIRTGITLGFSIGLMTSATSALATKPAEPYVNPHWADSSYPVAHATGDNTDAAGPVDTGHRRLKPEEIRYAPAGPVTSYAGLISGQYPDGRRVIWVGGYDRIAKVDAETMEILTTHSLAHKTYFGETEIERHLATLDRLADENPEESIRYGLKIWLEPWEDTNSFYRVLTKDNEFILPQRNRDNSTSIMVYGEEDSSDPASRIRLLREWRMPPKLTKSTICGLNIAPDGTLIFATMDGLMVALKPDFSSYTTLQLPAKSKESRTKSAVSSKEAALQEDIFDTFVRNGISIDDEGGMYIASRDYLYRVQWTGKKLSLKEKDGAWKVEYPVESGMGTGTTPTPMGWGPDEDHLVIMADDSKKNKAMVFWRDEIPTDWKGLPGFDRRVAGVADISFGVSAEEPMHLELAPMVWGYGALFMQVFTSDFENTNPMIVGDSPTQRWWTMSLVYHKPGYESRGASVIEWNPKTRKLETAWRNQTNYVSALQTVSRSTGIIYGIGARDGEWTIEGTDWHTGKTKFYYIMGKSHRYNPMGGPISIAPDGAIICSDCGLGMLRVMPEK